MKTTATIKHLKTGSFILIDDAPCKVEKVQASSTGKHGHAKIRVDAIGLLDGRRRSIVKPSHESVSVPIITKHKAQVLAISGDHVQLMDLENYSTFELPIPEELKDTLEAGGETDYFEIVGEKTLKKVK